jgi:hypothetical protein
MRSSTYKRFISNLRALLTFLILSFLLFSCNHPAARETNAPQTGGATAAISAPEHSYRHHKIHYTRHARCRMGCRHITETEVKEILQMGEINNRKSELAAHPCPKYALEGITAEHQHLRIIVGDCDEEATIITVIDLEHEFECDCH